MMQWLGLLLNKFDVWFIIGYELIDLASPSISSCFGLFFYFQNGMQSTPMLQNFPFHIPERKIMLLIQQTSILDQTAYLSPVEMCFSLSLLDFKFHSRLCGYSSPCAKHLLRKSQMIPVFGQNLLALCDQENLLPS